MVTKKLQERKKTNINKIKMKFCQVKKIVRNLEEKKYKTEKSSKEKKIIFKVDVAFFCHLSADMAT